MRDFRARTPIIKVNTSGVRATLYTCPQNARTKVPLVYIVNANGNVNVTFEVYKALTDTHFFILSGKNLALSDTLELFHDYIMLEPGDKLEVTCTGATVDVDAMCTVEETFTTTG